MIDGEEHDTVSTDNSSLDSRMCSRSFELEIIRLKMSYTTIEIVAK